MSHPQPTIQPTALSVLDSARYTGVSQSTIRRLAASGHLPSARIRGRVLFRVCDLDAMLADATCSAVA